MDDDAEAGVNQHPDNPYCQTVRTYTKINRSEALFMQFPLLQRLNLAHIQHKLLKYQKDWDAKAGSEKSLEDLGGLLREYCEWVWRLQCGS
jgi:hypothetical protein